MRSKRFLTEKALLGLIALSFALAGILAVTFNSNEYSATDAHEELVVDSNF